MADTTGLPMLRGILAHASDDSRPLYHPDRLRFALETVSTSRDAVADTEAMRGRLTELLGSDSFALEPISDEIDADGILFFAFAPNGIDRTLPEDRLFAIAADLRSALGLISCEPDIGANVFADPEEFPPPGVESAILDQTCWVKDPAPSDKLWALKKAGVIAAWTQAPRKGEGIIIAQPDTGVAEHDELKPDRIDRTRTANLIEGGTDPRDPLSSRMSTPGHGTATGSVAASGEGGKMSGSAPRAALVPIRCINDVKIFNGTPVAKAIDHAVSVGAHVITMSLGGVWSRAIRQSVKRAVARDIIVLAAAGNCVGLVVWPAAYPEVIAIGGTGPADRKWKGSSSGRSVDISAPAENVWRAERKTPQTPKDTVSGGQGTSFATALTAGVAALWLDKHGRAACIAEARRRGTTVQDLFRAAVQQTARRPAGFPSGLGAGIVEADALLRLPLAGVSMMRPEGGPLSDDASGGLADALTDILGPGPADPTFDWAAHGAEVSALLLADARAGRGQPGAGPEARAFTQASTSLAEAADASPDSRLAKLALRTRLPVPSILLPAPADPERTAQLLSRLGAATLPVQARTESARAMTPGDAQGRLDAKGREAFLTPIRSRAEAAGRPDLIGDVEAVEAALERLGAEGVNAQLSDASTLQLEALVSLTERPAIPVTTRTTPDGRILQTVDATNPEFGSFRAMVTLAMPDLERGPLAAVGRIDGGFAHLGTGFVVGDGLVMTNRHVLEHFASPLPRVDNPERWIVHSDPTIDFSPAGYDPAQRFRITDVAFAGPNMIGRFPISFDNLDLAVVRVETVNAAGAALPAPLSVAKGSGWRAFRNNLYVVGFPAAPAWIPADEQGAMRHDIVERLRELFGLRYGQKFFSPGMVQPPDHRWVFDHDATTLGGNSGSLAGVMGGNLEAVGLHFAGDWLRANHAHDLSAVRTADPVLDALLG